MHTVPNPAAERTHLPILVVAGLAVLVIQALRHVGLPMPPLTKALRALGVQRQRSYEMAEQIRAAITHLPRPVGRPPTEPEAAPDGARYTVCLAVRRFLEAHPGAHVTRRKRDGYSPSFRRFILRLRRRGAAGQTLPLPTFAEATGVPLDTLRDWLSGRRTSPASAAPEVVGKDPPVYPAGVIEQVVTLWRQHRGVKLADFPRILAEQHRIRVSVPTLVEILGLSGDRSTARPRKPKPDPEAIRGAIERFFPGAQWVADGKHVTVHIGAQPFSFTWELAVDVFTGAHVGFDIRDAEDGAGIVAALEHGIQTAGAPPLALLLDNRPPTSTDEVSGALEANGVLAMHSTPYRAQNKANVEGAFGLFAQTMPPIGIQPEMAPRELARSALQIALFAYCAGRNHVPRAGLGHRSAAQTYLDAVPTDEEREQALLRLREIQRRIKHRRDADAEREQPIAARWIAELFAEIGVDDPEGRMARSIARHGAAVVAEAIAVLRAKLNDGKSFDNAGRYLAGIATNLAHRNEHLAVYDHAVELRLKAHDELLAPLREQDRQWRDELGLDAYMDRVLDAALDDRPAIDRAYWRRALVQAIERSALHRPIERLHEIVRTVATSYRTPKPDRDVLIAALTELRIRMAAA